MPPLKKLDKLPTFNYAVSFAHIERNSLAYGTIIYRIKIILQIKVFYKDILVNFKDPLHPVRVRQYGDFSVRWNNLYRKYLLSLSLCGAVIVALDFKPQVPHSSNASGFLFL